MSDSEIQKKTEDKVAKPVTKASPLVPFKNKADIDLSNPLPQLDKGIVKAYAAEGKGKIQSNLFAMICEKSLTPRRITATKYANVKSPYLVDYIDSGKIVTPDGVEKFCFLYHYSLGKPVIADRNAKAALGKKPEDLLDKFVGSMIDLLESMANKDFTHGEIWPGNMFYSGASGDQIILGECLATPTSYNLPALYEPVERALAHPVGKGVGSIADDIYSFGVSLAVMLRHHAPESNLSDEQIIERKIEKGSYVTLLEQDRFSGATLEILRGLLYDDEKQRWTVEDIRAWQDGRRLTPKQLTPRLKAIRPIVMNGKKYLRPEVLAKDFIDFPADAAKLIESGDLSRWIERAIEDKSIRGRLEKNMKDAQTFDQGVGFSDRLTVAVSSVLFPEAPVMYKDLRFHPRGFGKYLTAAYVKGENIQNYIEVIRYYFATFIIRSQKKHDASSINGKFDAARANIKQTKMHAGIERCIYILNSEAPCLSPLFEKYYPINAEELVESLETICQKGKPRNLFDRHIVSFLFVKSKRNIEPFLMDMISDRPHLQTLGQLRTLATLQNRLRLDHLPHIAQWFARNFDAVYDRFHDDKKRDIYRARIEKLKEKGDLTKIALLFDDPEVFESDLKEFYKAIQYYKDLEKEKKRIQSRMGDKQNFGVRSGAQISSLLALILSAGIIVLTAYVMFLKGSF